MARMSKTIGVDGSKIGGNTIVYTYPDGAADLVVTSGKSFRGSGWEEAGAKPPQGAKRQKGKKSEGEDRARSARRAAAKLRRLALANSFDYFVTLTFDPEKVDSFDSAKVAKVLSNWADNMVRRKGLRYVIVPELHQSGRIHLHGFFAGEGLEVVDSGHVDGCGHPVYNLPQWGYGFTTAQKLYGTYSAAVGYCCKYIGKQDGERPMGRWYYSGGSLAEPEKTYAVMDYRALQEQYCGEAVEFEIPGSKMLVIHTKEEKC